MKIITGLSALAVALTLTAAYAAPADQPGHKSPGPGTNSESMSAVKDTTAGAVGTITAEMTSTTNGFVGAAAISDMYEVEAAKIAQARAHSADVKDFATKMIRAHTQSTAELKSILANNNVQVTPPSHLDDRRQGMIDDLRGANASDFDHRYVVQQIAAHKGAQILMRGYAKNGKNNAVKAFAAKTLPVVEDHLAMAERLESNAK